MRGSEEQNGNLKAFFWESYRRRCDEIFFKYKRDSRNLRQIWKVYEEFFIQIESLTKPRDYSFLESDINWHFYMAKYGTNSLDFVTQCDFNLKKVHFEATMRKC